MAVAARTLNSQPHVIHNDSGRTPFAWQLWGAPFRIPKGPLMSLFGSRGTEQPQTAEELLAEARDDYAQHNAPATQAAAREQSGQIRTTGNANGGSRWGR